MRYILNNIAKDLESKMVFVAGPRQSGKTTLAEHLVTSMAPSTYLNWDDVDHQVTIRKREWPDSSRLVALDEIHKWRDWQNFIKGTYDTQKSKHRFLVPGSARMDVYHRGGDSLVGRYHLWHLHPFSLGESHPDITEAPLERLLRVGGFPEPYLSGDERLARRWRRDRYQQIITQDVRDLGTVSDVQKLSLMVGLLRRRVGSEVVVSHIAQDIQVAPKTAQLWLEAAASVYLCFLVYPYAHKLPRAVQKPPKVFFYDTGDVEGDLGAKLENQMACELFKRLQYLGDRDGYHYRLHYLRDREKREVDFLITRDGVPMELIEVKASDTRPSRFLTYFGERLNVTRRTQLVLGLEKTWVQNGVQLISPQDYFAPFNSVMAI